MESDMSDREFIEYATRKVHELQWFEKAKAFAEAHLAREAALADLQMKIAQAQTKLDATVAEIEAERKRAAQAAVVAQDVAQAELRSLQQAAVEAKAKSEAEIAAARRQVQEQDRRMGLAVRDHEAFTSAAATERAGIQTALDALKEEQAGLKRRLSAAAGA